MSLFDPRPDDAEDLDEGPDAVHLEWRYRKRNRRKRAHAWRFNVATRELLGPLCESHEVKVHAKAGRLAGAEVPRCRKCERAVAELREGIVVFGQHTAPEVHELTREGAACFYAGGES